MPTSFPSQSPPPYQVNYGSSLNYGSQEKPEDFKKKYEDLKDEYMNLSVLVKDLCETGNEGLENYHKEHTEEVTATRYKSIVTAIKLASKITILAQASSMEGVDKVVLGIGGLVTLLTIPHRCNKEEYYKLIGELVSGALACLPVIGPVAGPVSALVIDAGMCIHDIRKSNETEEELNTYRENFTDSYNQAVDAIAEFKVKHTKTDVKF